METRHLTQDEINRLAAQGCTADDWHNITVVPGFTPDRIANVRFSGDIRLGAFRHTFTLPGGVSIRSGIRNATLHNVSVGDDTLIENIQNYIANYHIGSRCFIQNANLIVTEGRSTFGNGTRVSVLNETGGREVPIFTRLSAHLAYIIALYRHHPALIDRLIALIDRYAGSLASDRGTIGDDARIMNTGTLRNVSVGKAATIDAASRLKNGTIDSCAEAPVTIGHNVVAEDFIIASGASVTDGAALIRCFVGQACHLGHLFSAHDSLFFSNCQGENGEACAVFAGPYTVTMHKSSLLIAGMFSFLNAGSGSNQSNHLYKLGPIHQGIIERGSKTTSDSYILWPAKIGAFSLIMGRHVSHPDTSDLPFSYLLEQNNQTYLVPAVNLRSVGTIRDAQKWPRRDKRTDPRRLDCINFNLLSPYTIRKMLAGIELLDNLRRVSGETSEEYAYQSARIKSGALRKGIEYYTLAIHKFLGNSIIARLGDTPLRSDEDIRDRLLPDTTAGSGKWLDLCGLIAPRNAIAELLEKVLDGTIDNIEDINAGFSDLHRNYYSLEWTWAWEVMQKWYGITLSGVTAADIIRIVRTWKESVVAIDRMLYEDAKKEFSLSAQTGFGADGDNRCKAVDFERVRGAFENNPFVETVTRHIADKSALGDALIARLEAIATSPSGTPCK